MRQVALFALVLIWGIGAQIDETVASVGMVGGAVVVALDLRNWGTARLLSLVRDWLPLIAFVAWAALAPLLAGRLPTGSGLARLADWLGIPVAAYALHALDPRYRRSLAVTIGCVFLLSCAVAALQHFGIWPKPEFFAHLSWTQLPFQRAYEPIPGMPGRFMGCGLPFHRLKFAHVGGLTVLAALAWGFHTSGSVQVFSLATAVIGFLSILFFPYARAATIALIVSGLVVLALIHGRRRGFVIGGAALLAVFGATILVDAPLRERFLLAASDSGTGGRSALLTTGLNAVRANPILGTGLGQFRPSKFATADTPPTVLDHPGKAHNQFVTIAAEVGLPGLLLACALLGWLAASMRRNTPEGIGGFGALVFFVQLSLFHDPLFHGQFSMALALALGAAQSRSPPQGE